MAITVITEAQSPMLTTVETLRAQLELAADPTRDAVLEQCIRAASRAVVTYCGRDFAYQQISESMMARGSQFLRTSRFPIVGDVDITYQTVEVDSTLYSLDDPVAGVIYNSTGWNNTCNAFDYLVTYWYGFILPSYVEDEDTPTNADLPDDIEMAAVMLSKNFYLSRKRDFGIRQEEVPDVYKVMYNNAIGNESKNLIMTLEVQQMLDPYKALKL